MVVKETNKPSHWERPYAYLLLIKSASLLASISRGEEKLAIERSISIQMTSREQKRSLLYDKLQLLRSVTNSTALNKTSIIVDASKYIQELKHKVEALNQEIGTNSHMSDKNVPVEVGVEALEKGFLINVFSEKNCPGLLVSILEAFEDLGLDVLDARVSCSDCFQLEAVGGENQTVADSVDAGVVKHAVLEAIKNWTADT